MTAMKAFGLGVVLLVSVNGVLGGDSFLPDPPPRSDVVPPLPPAEERAAALRATVPPLIKALKDSDEKVRIHAAAALCNLDKIAVPALIELLNGKDNALRAQAAKILGNMAQHGRRHVAALPALTRALADEDVEVRRWAAYAINGISVAALEKQ